MTFAPNIGLNANVPTTRNFVQDDPAEFQLLMQSTYSNLANSVNIREIASYETVELPTGQQFFVVGNAQTKRYTFRKSFVIGAIAPGGNQTALHNISNITLVTHVTGGVVTANPDFRALPYASVTANANIEVTVTPTQYIVRNGAGGPAITSGILVIEYLKQ